MHDIEYILRKLNNAFKLYVSVDFAEMKSLFCTNFLYENQVL